MTHADPPATSSARTALAREVATLHPALVEVSHSIHDHPEIGGEERFARDVLAARLARDGFRVEIGVAGLATALLARKPLAGPGPCVAFLAEYDALPTLGHACGHSWIAAASLGAALALGRVATHLGGEVLLVGTPGEESFGGKAVMTAAGLFDAVDAAMMVHPSRQTVVDRSSLASCPVQIEFRGRAAHAAASPEEGRNALDAVLLTSVAVDMLARHLRDDVRLPRIVVHGGVAPNVVPERAVARYSLRAADRRYLAYVRGRVEDCARGAALATGTTVSFEAYEPAYHELVSSPVLVSLFRRELARVGVDEEVSPSGRGGSLDIGNVSHRAPALHADLRVVPANVTVHTPAFAAAAAAPFADARLAVAAEALAGVGLALLEHPALAVDARRALSAHDRHAAASPEP